VLQSNFNHFLGVVVEVEVEVEYKI